MKKKEDIIELWQKMGNIEIQCRQSSICYVALERIRNYCGKKMLQKKKKKNIKHFLKVKQVFSLLKNLHVI